MTGSAGPAGAPPSRPPRPGRRAVLLAGGGLAVGAAGTGAAWALTGDSGSSAAAPDPESPPAPSAAVPPDDDLMREHGVLKRVLLCYREMTSQVRAGGSLNAQHLHDAALVIHDFIEGFHEGLEEGFVFPRLRQAGRVTGTVSTLLLQHARGRVLTQFILAHTTTSEVASAGTRGELTAAMRAFVRMYEPHEAREDTVVFPAFRQLLGPRELADLGQHFADLEHQQFGRDEFTAMVGRVAAIEQALGVYDLARFTPDVTAYEPPR
ncbi:MAG: hemerythrin domain-containing protein [Streptosporangiaceae bacterium]